jgi:hypothetical protein
MPDMKHLHHVAFDREQDAIGVRSTTIEQLANFYGRVSILRSQRATGGEV